MPHDPIGLLPYCYKDHDIYFDLGVSGTLPGVKTILASVEKNPEDVLICSGTHVVITPGVWKTEESAVFLDLGRTAFSDLGLTSTLGL